MPRSFGGPSGISGAALLILLLVNMVSAGVALDLAGSRLDGSRGRSAAAGLRAAVHGAARRRLAQLRSLWQSEEQLDAAPAATNITGTFKGEWSQLAWPQQLAGSSTLRQGSGVAVLKLRVLPSRDKVRGRGGNAGRGCGCVPQHWDGCVACLEPSIAGASV